MPLQVDTTPFMNSIAKRTAWNTWTAYPEVTTAFNIISSPILVTHVSEELFSLLERFVILCYNRTSQNVSIDTERMELFRDKKRQMCNIPPSNGALPQKEIRSLLQAGWDWGQST